MLNKLLTLIKCRQGTFTLLAVFCVLVVSAISVGITSVPGIILGYMATTLLAATLTRSWQRIWNFLILLGACFVGFFLFAFLDQLVYGLGTTTSEIAAWHKDVIEVFHVLSSLIVAFVCPVGFLLGAAGSVRLFAGRNKAMAVKNT